MKKNLLLLALVSCSLAFSQCYINGNSSLKLSEAILLHVVNVEPRCPTCFYWETNNNNIIFSGERNKPVAEIKAVSVGTSIVTAYVEVKNGILQCSKVINIGYEVQKPNGISRKTLKAK